MTETCVESGCTNPRDELVPAPRRGPRTSPRCRLCRVANLAHKPPSQRGLLESVHGALIRECEAHLRACAEVRCARWKPTRRARAPKVEPVAPPRRAPAPPPPPNTPRVPKDEPRAKGRRLPTIEQLAQVAAAARGMVVLGREILKALGEDVPS